MLDKSLFSLSNLIKDKEVSPNDLVDSFLEKIYKTEPEINSYITICADNARKRALELERKLLKNDYLGRLHGIPYSAKDVILTKGIKTTAGSEVFQNNIPSYNAEIINRLENAGAVLLGKNNMHEFSFGLTSENEFYGNVLNPINVEYTSGGSSGGSAASVAVNSSVFSIGTDTGGSVRIPAAFCGVYGLRPTKHRVSMNGIIPFGKTFDNVGPIAKSSLDIACILPAIINKVGINQQVIDDNLPIYVKDKSECNSFINNITIGFCETYYLENLNKEIKNTFNKVLSLLNLLGFRVVQVDAPFLKETNDIYETIRSVDSYNFHKKLLKKYRTKYSTEVLKKIENGKLYSIHDYEEAMFKLENYNKRWGEIYSDIDYLVAPTTAEPPFPLREKYVVKNEKRENLRENNTINRTLPSSLNGFPVLSLPCGYTEDNLPLSIQVQGKPMDEIGVLTLAYRIEQEIWTNLL